MVLVISIKGWAFICTLRKEAKVEHSEELGKMTAVYE